jgi:hypothetical protein
VTGAWLPDRRSSADGAARQLERSTVVYRGRQYEPMRGAPRVWPARTTRLGSLSGDTGTMATCAVCGRTIPPEVTHLPCPTEGCGSLDRNVTLSDEGHGVDDKVRLDQDIPAYPRSWRDQWDRVQRWYERFRSTAEGRPHDMESLNYEDEMYAFFESCFHLKDWLKNDPAHPLSHPQDAEDLVNGSEPLRWCADVANGSKHLVASRRPRIDPTTGLGRRLYSIDLGNETPTTISARYLIIGAGQPRDAIELAGACIAAWDQFLRDKKLLPEVE